MFRVIRIKTSGEAETLAFDDIRACYEEFQRATAESEDVLAVMMLLRHGARGPTFTLRKLATL